MPRKEALIVGYWISASTLWVVTPASATNDLSFTVGPGSALVMPGETVTVTLDVANLSEAINGVQAFFHYDDSLMTLISIVPNPNVGTGWTEIGESDANGDVDYVVVMLGGSTSANHTVATLQFQALVPGTTRVTFRPDNPPFVTKLTRASNGSDMLPTKHDSTDIVIDCTSPEACCLPNNACSDLDPLCCAEQGGEPQGAANDCTALEACCMPNDTCQALDPLCCMNLGGAPRGVGTTCAGLQACCFGNDTCQNLDPECCDEQGGTPLGIGSVCLGAGACCRADGTCGIVDGACCADDGDDPQGPATICEPAVACCFIDGTCDDLAPVCCADSGGTSQGVGSVCLGDLDMDDVDDACLTTPDPPIGGDNTCQTSGADTGIPCSTDADCTEPAECGLKSRYISITPANPATATSIRVRVVTAPQFPAIVGHNYYAGPEQSIPNSPNPALRGAEVVCTATPHSQIWTTGTLHLFGASIVPTTNTGGVTTYAVAHCDANGDNCSSEWMVEMAKWGDVVRGFTGASQPNFADVNSIVQKFGNVASAPSIPRADIVGTGNPGFPNTPNRVANFSDVSNDVSAFSGFPYPYTVTLCP